MANEGNTLGNSVLEIAVFDTEQATFPTTGFTEFGGTGALRKGYVSFAVSPTRPSIPIPGIPGETERQSGDTTDATLAAVFKSNAITDPLFWGSLGKHLYYNRYPEGKGTGNRREQGHFTIDSLPHNPGGDRVFEYSLTCAQAEAILYNTAP